MNGIDNYINGLPLTPVNPDEPELQMGVWVEAPVIEGTGLIPVKLDATGSPIELTIEQAKATTWYSYVDTMIPENVNESKWANAITKNDKGEITGYFVWIPRYEYKINADKTIDVNFISKDTVTASNSDYIIHPAFTDESKTTPVYKNGGWNKEIPGFWMAKFEAGYAGNFAGKTVTDANNNVTAVNSELKYTGTVGSPNYYGTVTSESTQMKLPVFLPKTFTYNYINIGDMFNLSRAIQDKSTYYGLSNTKVDSHLIKNSEWGAVAYLTQSKYGRNGTEVTENNVNMANKVSRIHSVTGYAGSAISVGKNDLLEAPDLLTDELKGASLTSYAWNTAKGVNASSTGNMYGVYDLSGGAWEYAAGYLGKDNESCINTYGGTFAKSANNATRKTSTQYASVYALGSNAANRTLNYAANGARKGEAIFETSTTGDNSTSWNGDYSYFILSGAPFLLRGGCYSNEGTSAGVFAFSNWYGEAYPTFGFRVVLFPL